MKDTGRPLAAQALQAACPAAALPRTTTVLSLCLSARRSWRPETRFAEARGPSVEWRLVWSLRPLPCSTRMTIRLLSISSTFSAITSAARSPAPYATEKAALYFNPGAASRNRSTSSWPSTVRSVRGWWTWLILASKSARPRVTSKKSSRAVTAAFTLPRRTPRSTKSSWKRRRSSAVAVAGERLRKPLRRLTQRR